MDESLATKIKNANTILINDGNLEVVGDFFTSDYIVHLTDRILKGGYGTVKSILTGLRNSFPDIEVEVDILLEGEERVAWQRTLRGTHEGKFKGFPSSGDQIIWRDMVTSQFRDGLISEEWVISDLAEQLLLSRKRK